MICKKCGKDKKYYAKGMCKKCYHATLYKTNPNEYKLRFNKWRKANPEKARLQSERSNRKQGKLPISENPECSSWLGVHIAEQVLHKTFKNVVKKPYGFPGYDFICNKGMKIDVKAACLCANHGKQTQWLFAIRKNITADYFLCIAFDNRKTLTPLHLWLIPGNIINHLSAVSISISTVNKWKKYELDLTKTTDRFNKMINSENSATLANDNIYMMKYSIVVEDYRQITIRELVTAWGLHRHFDRMVEHLSNLAPDKINTMVAVQWDAGAYDVNHDEQKMLYFAVTNNEGEHIINGGVLFQHGQMSFHT